ncbi:Fpg/Nei family DNA glycosylase [Streptomyces sp. BI20]|uniref:Fpg/Nei family DNA glycosylase n=1 Tax=Streptomyces sp. BI20 TaxID=3403460 RepID=UPI003C72D5DE
MPELPEVEALAEHLADRLAGRSAAGVRVCAIQALKTFDPPVEALIGLPAGRPVRHGKFLDLPFGDLHLITHLARAGWLRTHDRMSALATPRPGTGPLAFRLTLDDDSGFDLTEAGTRKGLAVYVVRDPALVPGIARLGPDPLAPGFDLPAFAALLTGGRGRLKGVLRDQSVLAGVGNAYSDEVLHAARLSPYKTAGALTEEEVAGLYEALVGTLRTAVERARGHAAGELKAEKRGGMRVHGRTGEPCPVCGDTVREVSFADSSLQYCPTCQTGGRLLADRRMSRLLK